MSRKHNPRGNCRSCGKPCYGKHRICVICKERINQLAYDLNLLKRYPDIEQKPNEHNIFWGKSI